MHTVLHSGNQSQHVNGNIAFVLIVTYSPLALSAWKAAGGVFVAVSERTAKIRVKLHFSYATVIAVYAPTNPTSSASEALAPSFELYN